MESNLTHRTPASHDGGTTKPVRGMQTNRHGDACMPSSVTKLDRQDVLPRAPVGWRTLRPWSLGLVGSWLRGLTCHCWVMLTAACICFSSSFSLSCFSSFNSHDFLPRISNLYQSFTFAAR